jgi:uncharacterized protein YbjT (DUF2867 family)
MKIVVIGGSGLIGSKVVALLAAGGHEAIAASPASGVDTLSGQGLDDVLDRASVVVDVSNSPSFEDSAVMSFFTTSTRNLLAAEAAAGVRHHVALSVVGSRRMTDSGYMRAKAAQEDLIEGGPIPWSIVHATQFFEFLAGIGQGATVDGIARLAPVLIQPIAADDVAETVARTAVEAPTRTTVEVAGPEQFRLDELVERVLRARGDDRQVVPDPGARYFGTVLGERSLLPDDGARQGGTRFEDWLRRPAGVGR